MTAATPHTCLACGLTDWDVRMKLVIVPEDEQALKNVPIEREVRKGQPVEVEWRQVPELYAREPRCRDVAACDERVAAYRLSVAPDPEPEQEAPQWVI